MTKYCPSCKKHLPEDNFGKNKSRKDGLSVYCKKCNVLKNRQSHRKFPNKEATKKTLKLT